MTSDDQIKGFRLAIYRRDNDHTTGGSISRVNEVTMVTAHSLEGEDDPSEDAPEFWLWALVSGGIGDGGATWAPAEELALHELQEHNTHLYLVPAGEKPQSTRPTENFAYSPNRELREICKYPIPIRDRKR
jgi:hypothetical protein